VHLGNDTDEYHISDPIGLGLELVDGGNYLVFCGGTGILPFMDLFAYLLRRAVYTIRPEKALFPDE
jgi:ferredoxin-NADP reductase